jgi:hypothetical protein
MRSSAHATVKAELDHLSREFFRAVSFEPGAKPPFDTLHELFVPAGLLIKNSGATPEISTIDQFIAPRRAAVQAGELTQFLEIELWETTRIFGNVAHRFSAYAKSGVSKGARFEARGMISTQFVRTPAGWRISAMAWDDERPGLTLPQRES